MANLAHWRRRVKDDLLTDTAIGAVCSRSTIEPFAREAGHTWRESFWCPTTTLLTFLLQVRDGAKTLRAAVAVLLAQHMARGDSDLPSADPSAYCQARLRLPVAVAFRLLALSAAHLRTTVTREHTWRGHRVWIVDGSSASMPDTPALQKAFPQPSGQRPGCGFPLAQFVGLFCWSTGAIHDVEIDSHTPHELTLYRKLWHHFQPGDVVLGDRAYGSYVDLARLQQRGVFGVFRLHQRRSVDFRAGRRLGHDDRLITWTRPDQYLPSCGISRAEFEQLPATLVVRVLRITNAPRGFRSRTLFIVTTLRDPIETPADEVRVLYRDRWTAELNFRSLKTHLGMDLLRGHTPDIVRKEIAMHLVAYNLIRLLMWQAARVHARDLHRLSFTGTLHRLRATLPLLLLCGAHRRPSAVQLISHLLDSIAADPAPDRPNRIEPRRKKRRPKEYSLLQRPRHWYRVYGDPGAH